MNDKQNPLALHINIIHALPGLDMSSPNAIQSAGKVPQVAHFGANSGHKPMAIGIKGPWDINPGSPSFPNHRQFLTNAKPPSMVASPTPAVPKAPG